MGVVLVEKFILLKNRSVEMPVNKRKDNWRGTYYGDSDLLQFNSPDVCEMVSEKCINMQTVWHSPPLGLGQFTVCQCPSARWSAVVNNTIFYLGLFINDVIF